MKELGILIGKTLRSLPRFAIKVLIAWACLVPLTMILLSTLYLVLGGVVNERFVETMLVLTILFVLLPVGWIFLRVFGIKNAGPRWVFLIGSITMVAIMSRFVGQISTQGGVWEAALWTGFVVLSVSFLVFIFTGQSIKLILIGATVLLTLGILSIPLNKGWGWAEKKWNAPPQERNANKVRENRTPEGLCVLKWEKTDSVTNTKKPIVLRGRRDTHDNRRLEMVLKGRTYLFRYETAGVGTWEDMKEPIHNGVLFDLKLDPEINMITGRARSNEYPENGWAPFTLECPADVSEYKLGSISEPVEPNPELQDESAAKALEEEVEKALEEESRQEEVVAETIADEKCPGRVVDRSQQWKLKLPCEYPLQQ